MVGSTLSGSVVANTNTRCSGGSSTIFNALLKIVEEPPEHLVFVFATTEPDKVLPTIRSRTHHYPFRLVPPTTLRGLLEKTCAAEGVQVEHDPRRFATDLLDRLRDLIVLDAVPDAGGNGLLDCPPDRLDLMSSQARALGSATLSRMADTVHAGLTEMRGTTAPRLLLELVCARMLLPGTDDSAAATLQRLERLEPRMSIAGEHAGRPGAEPVGSAAPVREARPASADAVPEQPARPAREFVRRSQAGTQ